MENKLTLEHIYPYLPYGLKAEIFDYQCDYVGNQYDEIVGVHQWDKSCLYWSAITRGGSKPDIEHIKPIIRPLSDLSKEIEHNSMSIKCEPNKNSVIPSDLIYKHWFYTIREDGHFSYHIGDGTVIGSGYYGVPYDLVKILFQWHFDVFGLIKKGLAIDINTIDNA